MSRCRFVQHLFSAYIDGDLPPARVRMVEIHLGACPVCCRELAQWRGMAAGAGDRVLAMRSNAGAGNGLMPVGYRATRGQALSVHAPDRLQQAFGRSDSLILAADFVEDDP